MAGIREQVQRRRRFTAYAFQYANEVCKCNIDWLTHRIIGYTAVKETGVTASDLELGEGGYSSVRAMSRSEPMSHEDAERAAASPDSESCCEPFCVALTARICLGGGVL